jgi:hypothetical protein
LRKLVVVVVVVLAALVALDRVAVYVAEGQIAERVQDSQSLASRPDVSIKGFPFLTQVLRGRYKEVTASAHGIDREGLRLSDVTVIAEGVRVDLGDLVGGSVRTVPVDHARGSVLVSYDDLNAYLAQRVEVPKVQVGHSGSNLKVTGSIQLPVLNRTISLSGNARVDISGENVTLLPTAVTALTGFLPDFAQSSAQEALTVRFAIRGLPFGVRLDSAQVTDQGIRFNAFADGLTLSTTTATG